MAQQQQQQQLNRSECFSGPQRQRRSRDSVAETDAGTGTSTIITDRSLDSCADERGLLNEEVVDECGREEEGEGEACAERLAQRCLHVRWMRDALAR